MEKKRKKEKPGKKGTQLVLLFLLVDKKWIMSLRKEFLLPKDKTVALTTKEIYEPCHRNYHLGELFENYI